MQAEKDLNISGRMAINKFGIDKFNNHCKSSVMKYTEEWEAYVNRQARWVDFDNSYKTMDDIKRGLGLTDKEVKFIEEHFHKYEYENRDIIENCANLNKSRNNKKKTVKKNTKSSSNAKTRNRKKSI